MKYVCALTIAGSDCSGGAGIQADIKTMSALGVYAASAITAVTVQNTKGVASVVPIDADTVAGQVRAVMEDIHPGAVKIGLVPVKDTFTTLKDVLYASKTTPLVIDPVMVATSGDRLMSSDAIDTFIHTLLPLASLLTPNIPEAEVLAGIKICSAEDINEAARRILALGCKAVLVKGGHILGEEKTDRLYSDCRLIDTYSAKTVPTRNTHGTGCTLSSAITAYLARGLNIREAVEAAKIYLHSALTAGAEVKIGSGHGPVNHFFNPEKLIIR